MLHPIVCDVAAHKNQQAEFANPDRCFMPASVISVSTSTSLQVFRSFRFSIPASVTCVPMSRKRTSSVHPPISEPGLRDLYENIQALEPFQVLQALNRRLGLRPVRRSLSENNIRLDDLRKEIVSQAPARCSSRKLCNCPMDAARIDLEIILLGHRRPSKTPRPPPLLLRAFYFRRQPTEGERGGKSQHQQKTNSELEPASEKQGGAKPKGEYQQSRPRRPQRRLGRPSPCDD